MEMVKMSEIGYMLMITVVQLKLYMNLVLLEKLIILVAITKLKI